MINLINTFFGILIGWLIGHHLSCKYKRNYHGPDSNIVKEMIYKFKDKYYKFTPNVCICPI